MKRILLTLGCVLALAIPHSTLAQKANIGLNLAGALPLGNLDNMSDFGPGGDLTFDYYFNDRFDLGVELGYRRFGYSEPFDELEMSIMPLLLTAGLHTDISDNIDLYGELGGGAYMISRPFFDSEGAESSVDETFGGVSPRIGMAMDLSDLLFLDVSLAYNHVFIESDDLNWLGLKVGLLYTIFE